MIAFELSINGECVARAGAPELSVSTYSVTARGRLGERSRGTGNIADRVVLDHLPGGPTSPADTEGHAHWRWHASTLQVGDVLTLRVVECDDDASGVDAPTVLRGDRA
jgi:hypothetical protein